MPGNHDIPLYDVARRFGAPLRRYKRWISNDLCPWFENDHVAVLGINTARSLTFKSGRLNRDQMRLIEDRFAPVAESKTRILVTHHPLYAMPIGEGSELSEAVGGTRMRCGRSAARASTSRSPAISTAPTPPPRARWCETAGPALVIQAGTATSVRLRNDELQSFNWIRAHRNNDIELQVIAWDGHGFHRGNHVRFNYDGKDWQSQTVADE